jgi:1,4-alpha-glucan branching enzyme
VILTWKFFHPVLAVISLAAALGLGYMIRDTAVRQNAVPTGAQQVRIIFFSPEADSVSLVGDFNEWGRREVPASRGSERGMWEFRITLKPGVYHYNLLVDGDRWVANPKAATLVPDGFGGYNSVLVVSEKCRDDCA